MYTIYVYPISFNKIAFVINNLLKLFKLLILTKKDIHTALCWSLHTVLAMCASLKLCTN